MVIKNVNYFCISVQIGQCYDGEKNLNENITFKTVYLMGLGDALIYVNCRNVLNLDRYFYPDSLYSCRPLKQLKGCFSGLQNTKIHCVY